MRSLSLQLCAFAILSLAACSPLKELRNLHEKADDGTYHANLAAEYLSFAEAEQELGNEETSEFFAEKGLHAAKKEPTEPEKPENWGIQGDELNSLNTARARLLDVQTEFHIGVASHIVARSQLYYDCWVASAAGKHTNSDASSCQEEFLAGVKQLEAIEKSYHEKAVPDLPKTFDMYFGLGKDTLDKNARYTLREIANLAAIFPASELVITGHADRTGSHKRNMKVSQARANHVAEALIERGIDPTRITVAAKGAKEPKVPTLNGYSRKQNRRVEILIHEPEPEITDTAEKPETATTE